MKYTFEQEIEDIAAIYGRSTARLAEKQSLSRLGPTPEGIAFCQEHFGMTKRKAKAWLSRPVARSEPSLPATFEMNWPKRQS